MSAVRLAMALAVLLLLAGCKRKVEVLPVGGVYAVAGHATITIPGKKKFRRTAKAGMSLLNVMNVAVAEGVVVVEANNGRLYVLGRGPHDLSELEELNRPAPPTRTAFAIRAAAEEKVYPTLMVGSRYEPFDRGKLPKDANESDMKYFFAPGGGDVTENEDPGPPAPWMRNEGWVRPFAKLLPKVDGARTLTEVDGLAVVEFRDNSTAVASTLKLPLDLGEVQRVSVLKGKAKFSLPSGGFTLEESQVAEIEPLAD
ncbi:MAG: flagellar biosynthetic protein FliO [Myxococcales bacterium]